MLSAAAAATLVWLTTVSPVWAAASDEAPGKTDSGQIEEVVVTAQFKSENVQYTPIAITAIDSDRKSVV